MEQSSNETLFITRHFVTTCCHHSYPCCFNDRHQPVNNCTKHVRIVLGKMARTTLLVLLLYGGAVVVRKVISEHMRLGVDDAPEMRGVSTHRGWSDPNSLQTRIYASPWCTPHIWCRHPGQGQQQRQGRRAQRLRTSSLTLEERSQIGNSYRQRVTLHVHKNLYHAYQSKVHK